MSKIKKIEVKNFKAISEEKINFDGCSTIVTAGNNKGKTSLLRGLIDRFRSEKADIIVKEGEKKGYQIMELTDGSRFEWNFTKKTESFAFITKEGIKQTTGLLKSLGKKYFGIQFDIDKFLNSSPRKQSEELQKIIGLNLSEIDKRYSEAYDDRTEKNRELKRLRSYTIDKPVEVVKPNIDDIKSKISQVKEKNKIMMSEWELENKKHQEDIHNFNSKQRNIADNYNLRKKQANDLKEYSKGFYADAVDVAMIDKLLNELDKPEQEKEISYLRKPKLLDLTELEKQLENANNQLREYDKYVIGLKSYNEWVESGKKAKKEADNADTSLKAILEEKEQIIRNAKIPDGFEFSEDGLIYNGFPLNSNQISSSQKYIAGLILGSLGLGEIKTLHFDASFLDKNSLQEVQDWANKNDYQLLIERPNFDGGEIKYEII